MSKAAPEPSKATAPKGDQPIGLDHSKVLECYKTRSGPRLAALFDQLYTPDTTFADPFASATPRYEARLQFLSLQHFFDSVDATASNVTTTGNETRMDVHFDYYWSRNSWLSRMILPEVTPLDAQIILQQDPATGKITSHVDEWLSPAVNPLPTAVRQFNVKAMNAVFRLLGWESELKPHTNAKIDGLSLDAGKQQ